MPEIKQKGFKGGWNPSADAYNAPPDCLLRADNLNWDEEGAVNARPIYSVIAATGEDNVHSLYTQMLGNDRVRLAGAGDNVYRYTTTYDDSTLIAGPFDSDHDYPTIKFGSDVGNILMARGTTKKRYNGEETLDWGLEAPDVAPQVAAMDLNAEDLKTKYGAWAGVSPTATGTATGPDGSTTDATTMTIASIATGRGVIQKIVTTPLDLSTGGKTSGASDIIQIAVNIDLNEARAITLTFGINGPTGNRYLDNFHYTWKIGDPNTPVTLTADELTAAIIASNGSDADIEAIKESIQKVEEARRNAIAQPTSGLAGKHDTNWVYFFIPRKRFIRTGSTPGCSWNAVYGIRIRYECVKNPATAPAFWDTVKLIRSFDSKVLAGKYQVRTQIVREGTDYFEKSPPSPPSDEINLIGQGLKVTIPGTDTADYPTGDKYKLYTYLYGGLLDKWYLAGKSDLQTRGIRIDEFSRTPDGDIGTFDRTRWSAFGFSPGDSVFTAGSNFVYTIAASEVDLYTQNQPLEQFDVGPPDDIIGIVGPFQYRTFCLTFGGELWISRRGNPSSFPSAYMIPTCKFGEVPYWVRQSFGAIYVGTSKNIYRISGSFFDNPDGTLDVSVLPINIPYSPISRAVTSDGYALIYLAETGWRAFNGETSVSLGGTIDLLYKGQERYGVPPVNFRDRSASCLATFWRNHLIFVVPETTINDYTAKMRIDEFAAFKDTSSSNPDGSGLGAIARARWAQFGFVTGRYLRSSTTYRYNVDKKLWYRYTYPSGSLQIQSIFPEPDGTLAVGSALGGVHKLDDHDAPVGGANANIDVVLYSPFYDDETPGVRKDLLDAKFHGRVGNSTNFLAVHFVGDPDPNGVETELASMSVPAGTDAGNVVKIDLASVVTRPTRRVQVYIDQTCDIDDNDPRSFSLTGWSIHYRPRPTMRKVVDTGHLDFGAKNSIVWLRECKLKISAGGNVEVEFWGDGVLKDTKTVIITPGIASIYTIPLDRDITWSARSWNVVVKSVDDDGVTETDGSSTWDVGFDPYWISFRSKPTGGVSQKPYLTVNFK